MQQALSFSPTNFDIIKSSAIKQRKQNCSLNKKNKKGKKTFKVQKNLCTGAQKIKTKRNKLKQSHMSIK